MAISMKKTNNSKTLEVQASGKLAHEDYQLLVPKVEEMIKELGKIRMLVEMKDFHGWKGAALWDDIKFDAKHFSDIERIAMVGERKWEKAMSVFCRAFTTAKIRYFDRSQFNAAREWLEEL